MTHLSRKDFWRLIIPSSRYSVLLESEEGDSFRVLDSRNDISGVQAPVVNNFTIDLVKELIATRRVLDKTLKENEQLRQQIPEVCSTNSETSEAISRLLSLLGIKVNEYTGSLEIPSRVLEIMMPEEDGEDSNWD